MMHTQGDVSRGLMWRGQHTFRPDSKDDGHTCSECWYITSWHCTARCWWEKLKGLFQSASTAHCSSLAIRWTSQRCML